MLMYTPKTVLITGVAGLLGSNLAAWILKHHPSVRVIGIDDFSGGYESNIPHGVVNYNVDIATGGIDSIFAREQPDIVYHMAAYAAEALSPFMRRFNYTNNLVATAAIVSECIAHSVKRLVFTSSMSVYGAGTPPFSEADTLSPIDPYAIAKAACEADIKVAGTQHGLDWCIIRPHNFYGPMQNIWDSYRNVLGIWMYKRLTGSPLTIFGDGSQVRAFSYIDDALEPLWQAAVSPKASKQIINLGGIEPTTILEAAELMLEVTGGGELVLCPPRHEVKHAVPTWGLSEKLLGFKHNTSLRDGLKIMWEWAQQQPTRPRQVWSKYELDKGIYPFWDKQTLISQAASAKEL